MVDTDNSFVFVVYVTVLLVPKNAYANILRTVNSEMERMQKVIYWHLRRKISVEREGFSVWSLKFQIRRTAKHPATIFD